MKKSYVFAGAMVAATLLLVGCGTEVIPPTGDASPAPTVTVTAAPDAGSGADYGFTFFEEAQLGSTWEQLGEQLHYPVAGIDECPWYGTVWNSEITLTYAFFDPADIPGGAQFFYTQRFLAPDDAPFPRNAEGVGVGSTQAEVTAAYPTAVLGSVDDLGAGHITTVTVEDPDSDSRYVFGISDGSAVVDMLQWGPTAGSQWSHLCTGF